MERPMVEKVLWVLERLVRFAAEGSLLMNWKNVLLKKEQVITQALRPESPANNRNRACDGGVFVLSIWQRLRYILVRLTSTVAKDMSANS